MSDLCSKSVVLLAKIHPNTDMPGFLFITAHRTLATNQSRYNFIVLFTYYKVTRKAGIKTFTTPFTNIQIESRIHIVHAPFFWLSMRQIHKQSHHMALWTHLKKFCILLMYLLVLLIWESACSRFLEGAASSMEYGGNPFANTFLRRLPSS